MESVRILVALYFFLALAEVSLQKVAGSGASRIQVIHALIAFLDVSLWRFSIILGVHVAKAHVLTHLDLTQLHSQLCNFVLVLSQELIPLVLVDYGCVLDLFGPVRVAEGAEGFGVVVGAGAH